jgi:osmotically inducible lipoprotein OsmB
MPPVLPVLQPWAEVQRLCEGQNDFPLLCKSLLPLQLEQGEAIVTRKLSAAFIVGAVSLGLAACGTTPGGRAVSGGLLGAGAGAGVSAVTGGNVGTDALVRGGVGAAGGTLAAPRRY